MTYGNQREFDPLIVYQFGLDLGNNVLGFFSEVSGIGSESEVIEDKVVTDGHDYVHKMPGRLKWGDVTLKRGITNNLEIWEWRQQVEEGKMTDARKNCAILLYDRAGEVAARWDFLNAWPSKVSGPDIKADSNEFGVEEMVLVHEGMKRNTI
jgi:phage tail-like protein